MCDDKMPLVRKNAAKNISDFAKSVPQDLLESELIPKFESLSIHVNHPQVGLGTDDELEYIKIITVDHLHEMADLAPDSETLLAITRAAIQDNSWKIRLSIAKQIDKLVNAFGTMVASQHLLDDLGALLRDTEGEVKRETVHSFTKCIHLLDLDRVKESSYFSVLKECYKEEYADFKEGVAESICEIAFHIDEHDVTDELMPIMIKLMKDKTPQVKIRVVEGIAKMSKALGPKIFNKELNDSFKALLNENQWRIRHSVYDLIGQIGLNFGQATFADTLEPLFLSQPGYL